MDLDVFKKELRLDIRRMQAALAALEGPEMMETTTPKLSQATRDKISESMKANWAGGRKRTLSKAVKAKIAASQKARWAKQKEAATAATAAA
jgi:hypothetical protein